MASREFIAARRGMNSHQTCLYQLNAPSLAIIAKIYHRLLHMQTERHNFV